MRKSFLLKNVPWPFFKCELSNPFTLFCVAPAYKKSAKVSISKLWCQIGFSTPSQVSKFNNAVFGLFFISIYETVATWLEYLKITPSKKILKGNTEIENLQELLDTQFNEIHGYDVDNEEDDE